MKYPNGDRVFKDVVAAASEFGIRLLVSLGGEGHYGFRHWRFFRGDEKMCFMNYWPKTGKWATPDGDRGIATDGWSALEVAKKQSLLVVILGK